MFWAHMVGSCDPGSGQVPEPTSMVTQAAGLLQSCTYSLKPPPAFCSDSSFPLPILICSTCFSFSSQPQCLHFLATASTSFPHRGQVLVCSIIYENKDAMDPTMATINIRSIQDMIKPAMARPLGLLNRPMKENSIPRNHTTQLTPGIQHNISEINAMTNPAVPSPLDCCPI